MILPELNELAVSRSSITQFGGYNHNVLIADGEFYDMKNMSSKDYPVLSVRNKRGTVAAIPEFGGMIAKDALAYVDGTRLIYNGKDYEMGLNGTVPKQLVSMGAYIVIFPDAVLFNTQDFSVNRLGAEVTVGGTVEGEEGGLPLTVTFDLCTLDGTAYGYTASDTEPPVSDDQAEPIYWLDTSTIPNSFKVYSKTSAMWMSVGTVYVKISCPGIGEGLNQYDAVKITGCATAETKQFNGNTYPIWAWDENYIVIVGMISAQQTQEEPITLTREIPTLDYVCESNNRLWGCHYGVVGDKVVNEIYACKLGDPFNWNCFMGTSTDSYTASLGSDGAFTGAVNYLGYPTFFKENCIHRIFGTQPSNYQLDSVNCRGVQKGSHNSIVTVNEILYYKSATDICAFDGSLPVSVSAALGAQAYRNASAGALGEKYYISMEQTDGEWAMFAYDTKRGIWHKEDNIHADEFCRVDTCLYFFDKDKTVLMTTNGGTEGDFEWFAETGEIGYDLTDSKYISRLVIRMSLDIGARASLYIQYDSSGVWEHKGSMNGRGTKSFTLPVTPRRCDHLKMKLAGYGNCRIFSIAKNIETGSDV